jgi:hypothetical protein
LLSCLSADTNTIQYMDRPRPTAQPEHQAARPRLPRLFVAVASGYSAGRIVRRVPGGARFAAAQAAQRNDFGHAANGIWRFPDDPV